MSGLAELRNDLRNEVRYGLRYLVRDSAVGDRKSTRLNSSHSQISYAVFCLKKKKLVPTLQQLFRRRDLGLRVRVHLGERPIERQVFLALLANLLREDVCVEVDYSSTIIAAA